MRLSAEGPRSACECVVVARIRVQRKAGFAAATVGATRPQVDNEGERSYGSVHMKPPPDVAGDPFAERLACGMRMRVRVLGGLFEFESNSRKLLNLVELACAGLPAHTFCTPSPRLRIRLLLSPHRGQQPGEDVPPMHMHAGAGLLCGTMDSCNFAVVSPTQARALVVVSAAMLRHPYHTRYELIEFALYTLASRAQQLISLHAASVGRNDHGLLLIGPSGAGKSTLSLHCLLQQMELVGEDAILVEPRTLLATGIGSFLHLTADSLAFMGEDYDDGWMRRAPVIRRRSGIEKFEIDMRRSPFRIARKPPELTGVVFLSRQRVSRRGEHHSLLAPLRRSDFVDRLQVSQPYAANQPGWTTFRKHLSRIEAFELRRARHPDEAVEALQRIIG
jgi:hypothetical protein